MRYRVEMSFVVDVTGDLPPMCDEEGVADAFATAASIILPDLAGKIEEDGKVTVELLDEPPEAEEEK